MLYRFADYNAGQYASRNAAVQRALAQLTGAVRSRPTETSWSIGPDGRPTGDDSETLRAFRVFRERFVPTLPEARLRQRPRRRARSRPSRRRPATSRSGASTGSGLAAPCPTAAVPELELKSPKLRRGYSTGAYARSVLGHHRACLQRLRGGAPD